MLLSFINNISLLLALSICHSFILKRWKPNTLHYQIASGILFGCIIVAGMMNPFVMTEGIIFDGRSFIASIAGLMGGSITAISVILIGGAYRIWGVGGGGTLMGVCVLATSASLGVLYRYWRSDKPEFVSPLYLYCFGVIVHLAMILWMFTLPASQVWMAISKISMPVMVIFPICTVVLGKMLQEQINNILIYKTLKKSEEKYRQLVENANSIILRLDKDGKITFFNEYAQKFFGYSEEDVIGRSIFGTIVPETDSTGRDLSNITEQISNNPEKYSVHENENICMDGERVWVSWTNKVIFDEDNLPTEILCIGTDITERRQAEIALHNEKEFTETALNYQQDTFFLFEPATGKAIRWNRAFNDITGYTDQEIAGMAAPDSYYSSEDIERIGIFIQGVLETGIGTIKLDLICKDGHKVPTEYNVSLVKDEKGAPKYFISIGRDITERKQAEKALKDSEERVKEKLNAILFQGGDIGSLELSDIIDAQAVQALMDDFCDLTGFAIAVVDIQGKVLVARGWQDICMNFHRINTESCKNCTESDTILSSGIESGDYKIYRCKNNMWDISTPIVLDGKHLGNVFMGQFFYSDEDIDYEVFRAQARQYGFDEQAYLAALDRVPRWNRDKITQVMSFYSGFARLISMLGFSNIKLSRALTEREQAEEALRESEKHLRTIFEAADNVAFVTTDLGGVDTRIFGFSPGAENIFGYKAEEIIGRKIDILHLPDVVQDFPSMQQALRNGKKGYSGESTLVRKSGEHFTALLTIHPRFDDAGEIVGTLGVTIDITDRKQAEEALRDSESRLAEAQRIAHIGNWIWDITKDELSWSDEIYKIFGLTEQEFAATDNAFLEFVHPDDRELQQHAVKKALNREEPYIIDHRIVLKNGEIRFVHEAAEVLFSDDGVPLKMIGTIQNITERKRVEEELLKARKLESVGILAGGIAHDFNNLLMAIVGNISLAKTFSDSPDKINQCLSEAQKASNRAQSLTQQLLTFSKGGSPVRESANVIELVKETATFSLRGSNVTCDFHFPDNFWPVDVDKGQFSQVIQNLVINADQAMPDGGIIDISGENITFSDKNQKKDFFFREGDYVQLLVIDQGIGISKDHIQKIFDPYFTTKQKGNGLGLATTYSIIKNHQGNVTVESQIGVGTTFTIYLPRSLKDCVSSNATNQEQLIKGQGRILIMDDEKMIRDVTGKMLEYLGYEVDYAEDGSKAIEQYKNASDSGNGFDVIIMDLTIPGGMGGKETIQKLLEIDPQVKAIVSSGYSGDPIMSDYKKYGFSGVIGKPYELESLGGMLHSVINESNL
jgi:PAS domain S-box-containing protein